MERADGHKDFMATKITAVEMEAEIRQVKSMADHTYNITLNIPEYCIPQVQEIMGWLQDQVRIVIQKTPE